MDNQPIPQEFLERMAGLLGREYAEFLRCYDEPPVSGLRVNTLKLSILEFLQLNPFELTPIPWCPPAFHIIRGAQPGKHPYHAAGLYYLQDPSAMLAAEVLSPAPGDRVLDLAAAPGGKTTHLAALMQGQGYLLANEIHPRRVWELAENLERWGAGNVTITNETPERLVEHFGAYFDRVLLDAPCSGEGMFRKSEAARRAWSPVLVERCAARQVFLLEQASRLVSPGGFLLYTTCTFSPEENEGVITRFLASHPEFDLGEISYQSGFVTGKSEWLSREKGINFDAELKRTVRLFPHKIIGEGHFLALLRRAGENQPQRERHQVALRISPETRHQFEQFKKTNLNPGVVDGPITQSGSYLYQLPVQVPNLKGLHVIHPGLWLGTLKKQRFEPSHALAMTLKSDQAMRVINIDSDQPQTLAYLRGESFPSPNQDAGWTLITIDHFPLGWGKCTQGIVKNYYPRGLRWL